MTHLPARPDRPPKIPATAYWDEEVQMWVSWSSDGLYDYEYSYNEDGMLVSVIEMEI